MELLRASSGDRREAGSGFFPDLNDAGRTEVVIFQPLGDALMEGAAETAERLESQVRELIETVTKTATPTKGKGRPPGYFERTYGSFRDEPLERPEQLPFEKREEW